MSSDTYIDPTAVVDEGCTLGAGVKVWHFTHLAAGCVVGDGCSLGQNVYVAPMVVLGKNVRVQNNVSLYDGVVCEDDVFIGPSAVFTNVLNPRSAVPRKHELKQTVVRRGATIGANATIVCGNEIGQYALVGAGSVLTKPVPAYALMMGNPARQAGWVSEHGHRLWFNENGESVCKETGLVYRLRNGSVFKH